MHMLMIDMAGELAHGWLSLSLCSVSRTAAAGAAAHCCCSEWAARAVISTRAAARGGGVSRRGSPQKRKGKNGVGEETHTTRC